MIGLIEELPPRAELVVIAPHKAEKIEPAELHGEQQLHERSEKERRQRDARERDHRNGIVSAGILLRGGDDAEGDRDDDLEKHRDEPHHERQPDGLVEFLDHRHRIVPTVAEIKAQSSACP